MSQRVHKTVSSTTDSTGSTAYGSSSIADIQRLKTNIDQVRADMLSIAGQSTSGGQVDSAGLVMPAAGGIFSSSASSSVTIPPVIKYVNTGGSGGAGGGSASASAWIPTAGKTAVSQGITATGADLRCAPSSTSPATASCALYISINGHYYDVGTGSIGISSLSAGTYNPPTSNYLMPASYIAQVSWDSGSVQGKQYYNSRGTKKTGSYIEANVTPSGMTTTNHVINPSSKDQTIGTVTEETVGWR